MAAFQKIFPAIIRKFSIKKETNEIKKRRKRKKRQADIVRAS